jgi:transposase-like protein
MRDDMREKQLNIRLSPDEAARVDALASHYGLNPANLMRFLIKQASDVLAAPPMDASRRTPSASTGSAVPKTAKTKRRAR